LYAIISLSSFKYNDEAHWLRTTVSNPCAAPC